MNKRNNQKGFSLVELLVVVVIIGIVAALAIPALQKGIRAAENGTTFATMRSISSTQVMFFSQNNRFGRLPEIQAMMGNGIGTTLPDSVVRGRYVFQMTPVTPTDNELKTEYVITATRSVSDDIVYKYELTQSGKIKQILPLGSVEY
ncbi:MAG TPA: prepilin-type N-terminal cleavage/methylation domain-containing protein [Pyrinomonadaceae bacterium]|nr:prepilin-type N-terminal cleavage/methylation domain-containing protein [Pyrinomonadaceae bacterium]